MEKTPAQEPLKQPEGKAIPDPNTDFGDETFDPTAMPQGKVSVGGFNDWLFGLMRPKRKVVSAGRNPIDGHEMKTGHPIPLHHPDIEISPTPRLEIPRGFVIQNGLLMRSKNLAERARDQILYPILKSTNSMINGAALVLFAIGAIILYSELPTRPELVIGILLIAISANIIISNR
jgi:hypothetical protein